MLSKAEVTSSYISELDYKIGRLETYKDHLNQRIKYLDPIDSEICSGNKGIEEINESLKQILTHIDIMLDYCYSAKNEIYSHE